MWKITISCIILTLCINSQGIETAFIQNPLNSMLNNAQNQASNIFDNIKDLGSKTLENIGNNVLDIKSGIDDNLQEMKNKCEEIREEYRKTNISACTNLCKEGYAAFISSASTFTSCFWNERASVNSFKILFKLISSVLEILRDSSKCFVGSPNTIGLCIGKTIAGLYFKVKEIMALKAVYFFAPAKCIIRAEANLAENFLNSLNTTESCIQEILCKYV